MYKKTIAFIVVLLTLGLLFVSVPQAKAQFVIAEWEYPDEHGQGIFLLWCYENSTGDFVKLRDPAFIYSDESTNFDVNATGDNSLKVIATVTFNHTYFGIGADKADNATARDMMRVSIEVVMQNNIVFSQDNMTWDGTVFDNSATVWELSYTAIINVLLVSGAIYTATVTYEVYW